MRLDKLLVSTGKYSRSEAGRVIRGGNVTVNGRVEKHAACAVDPEADTITLDGQPLIYRQYTYILLNKPDGYVSATEDGRELTVLTLLPDELQRIGLFPCGRLDKHTLGLMLLTNDGALGHRLLSPRHHVPKKYAFTCQAPLSEQDCARLSEGVELEDGYRTKSATVTTEADGLHGTITLTEGKYHQIKRMMEAVGNRIVELERITFGPLVADATLARGQWRYLTDAEIEALRQQP